LPVAVEEVALVEARLSIVARRVRVVAERLAAREQRRLPAVAPETGELAHALAADAQASSIESMRVCTDLERTGAAEELLPAVSPAHQVALHRRRQPLAG